MASSASTVRSNYPLGVSDPRPVLEKIAISWTAHTDGTFADYAIPGTVYGVLQRIVTAPGATAPTALYDITIVDEDGFDVLNGAGANKSATATEESEIKMTTFQRIVANTLTLKIANNAVASAQGTIRVYVLR